MFSIVQANIERFKMLLELETDPTKRLMIIRLLTEEEAKLPVNRHMKEGCG